MRRIVGEALGALHCFSFLHTGLVIKTFALDKNGVSLDFHVTRNKVTSSPSTSHVQSDSQWSLGEMLATRGNNSWHWQLSEHLVQIDRKALSAKWVRQLLRRWEKGNALVLNEKAVHPLEAWCEI